MNVIIIGSGPAGLFCAATLAEGSADAPGGSGACLLESNPGPGKKLLLTGSGQCNFTHEGDVRSFLSAYGGKDKERFLRKALFSFSNEDVKAFFRDRGLPSLVREDGKVFPSTLRAEDLLQVLLRSFQRGGVSLRVQERVLEVSRSADADSSAFSVRTAGGRLESRFLVIATGGLSWPGTGSTGDGYRFAEAFGHTLVPPRPALAPLTVQDYRLAELSGVSLVRVPVALWKGGRKKVEAAGDLVFTHTGISGPVIQNLSRFTDPGDTVTLDLTFSGNGEPFLSSFPGLLRAAPALTVKESVRSILQKTGETGSGLPKRLLQAVLEQAGLSGDERCGNLTRESVRRLGELLTAFPLAVERAGSFSSAMTTAGGVKLSEVDPESMESRIVPGLFFAGEVLDLDGDSGGYNIQAAFSTGYLAARTILERVHTVDRFPKA